MILILLSMGFQNTQRSVGHGLEITCLELAPEMGKAGGGNQANKEEH